MQINYELCSCIFAAIGFLVCVWCVILYNKIENLQDEISMSESVNKSLLSKCNVIEWQVVKKNNELALLQRKLITANANKASLTNQVKSLKKKLAK
jgi:hypothetical protein